MSNANVSLQDLLAASLPVGLVFTNHHISTPPTRCAALFPPLPGRKPEGTYCESHFLMVTIHPDPSNATRQVAIFAIEVLVYTTKCLTTVFVSKADSTGFAPSPKSAQTTGPPLRLIASTFVSWLIKPRHRSDRKLVVSLFARAQGQYLFPGSVDHGKKHVLDDRGLVKWWCRTLDPVLREYVVQPEPSTFREDTAVSSTSYLLVPGQDKYETTAFLPSTAKVDDASARRWIVGHPLHQLAQDPHAPPRCLIPHFPDDPKARYLLELDDEVIETSTSLQDGSSKRGTGQWRTIKTLEQFWEMMAFRQECSSGRLVGFLWVVFTPISGADASLDGTHDMEPIPRPPLPSSRAPKRIHKKNRPLSGPILPRAPRVKSGTAPRPGKRQPEITAYYHWPLYARGTIVLDTKPYTRIIEGLLRLDYANLDIACESTAKWIREASVVAGCEEEWGVEVVGRSSRATADGASTAKNGEVNVITVKRKKRPAEDANGREKEERYNLHLEGRVTTLDAPQPSKKSKVLHTEDLMPEDGVTMLNSTLIRKKPKVP